MCHAIRYTRTSRSVVRRYTSKLTGTHDPRRRTLAKSELPKRERCCHYVRPPRERPDFTRQPCFRSGLPWKKNGRRVRRVYRDVIGTTTAQSSFLRFEILDVLSFWKPDSIMVQLQRGRALKKEKKSHPQGAVESGLPLRTMRILPLFYPTSSYTR